MPKKSHYKGPPPICAGNIAVAKRLASAGMHATKIELYKGQLGCCWEADTERGKRWVSHGKDGWRISKVPPGARNKAPATMD